MSAAPSPFAADLNVDQPVPLGEERASPASFGSKAAAEESNEISIQDLQAKTALELVAEVRRKLTDGRASSLVATLVSSNLKSLCHAHR